MNQWPFDRLGWWAYAVHCVCSQHDPNPIVQELYKVADTQDHAFLQSLKDYYGRTLRLIAEGNLGTGDAKRLLFRAKCLKKWKLAPPEQAEQRRKEALVGFLKRNDAAGSDDFLIPYPYREVMKKVLANWLPDPRGSGWSWTGRFGPGAVAEHWTLAQKIEHLHQWIHSPGWRAYAWPELPPESDDAEHVVARLCAVPKEYTKDRLITVEPGYSSFAQQYVREMLQCSIHLGPLNGSCMDLGFTDGQAIQRRLALKASENGSLATLDLSDASDNITYAAVREVFPSWVVAHLDTCRTPYITTDEDVEGCRKGQRVPLRIYAGMGNGTTFTVETLFFAAFVKAYAFCHGYRTMVSVFGDDIICSSDVGFRLARENFAFFKVNREKSFIGADALRESCGIFAYNGVDITVPKVDGYGNSYCDRISLCDLERRLRGSGEAYLVHLAHLIAAEGILVNWKHRYPGYPSIDAPECERSAAPLTRWNPHTCYREARLPVVTQRMKSYSTDSNTAARFNHPDPVQWYEYRLLSMFGSDGPAERGGFTITSPRARRRWSVQLPVMGSRQTRVEWVSPLPDTTAPFIRDADLPKGRSAFAVNGSATPAS